jgi:16S rRNA (cytidine1402-2'-O)-methyltransferase
VSASSTPRPGTLYLVPAPLGPDDDPLRVLPPATVEAIAGLGLFVAEHARSARAVLGRLPMRRPLQEIEIVELNRHTPEAALPALLAPVLGGRDAGLLSEAGVPAVADPGAALVALAHREGVTVVPLVGPSSLLLALMASGMNGQAFAFAGYVPVDPEARARRLRELERRSAANGETVLLIETPYRNQALFDAMLQALDAGTLLGVAARLTLPGESIRTRTVAQWRALGAELERTPTVFSLQAPSAVRGGPAPGRAARPRPGGRERRGVAPRRPANRND